MEIKAAELKDAILKMQGQIELLSGLYQQALALEKKTEETANESAQKS